jgi:hypothetical protein
VTGGRLQASDLLNLAETRDRTSGGEGFRLRPARQPWKVQEYIATLSGVYDTRGLPLGDLVDSS